MHVKADSRERSHADPPAVGMWFYIMLCFLLTQTRVFAKSLAAPAACIQAAVTVQRFRGLWAKRWTQGSLNGEDWFQLRGGGWRYPLQTLGGVCLFEESYKAIDNVFL